MVKAAEAAAEAAVAGAVGAVKTTEMAEAADQLRSQRRAASRCLELYTALGAMADGEPAAALAADVPKPEWENEDDEEVLSEAPLS
jgi:hypothetical protein